MLQDRKRQNRKKKHDRKYYCPPSSLRVDKTLIHQLENLKLRVVVRPRTRTRTLLTLPLRFLRAFRWSRPSTLSSCRFALASLGDARAADALRFVVVKHAAAITLEPPATSSLTDVAMRGLRRSVLLIGTVHRLHKAWCASALRRALRVSSSMCTLASVLRLSAVCLSVCVQPALLRGTRCLTCTIAGSACIVQVLHY